MAGDWIKMRADLFTHPKVVRISSALKADTLRTVGGLMSVWCLFDAHSIDGSLDGYTLDAIDSHLRWDGFSAAMMAVGWLIDCGESLELPEFDTHNGASAKRRAQDADRKRNDRKTSATEADKMRTREEKRREEKNKYKFSSDDLTIAELMAEKIFAVTQSTKKPNLESWANEIRLMRESDHRNLSDIRAVFLWANDDSFWRANILSPPTLRKQFDKLFAKRNSEIANGQPNQNFAAAGRSGAPNRPLSAADRVRANNARERAAEIAAASGSYSPAVGADGGDVRAQVDQSIRGRDGSGERVGCVLEGTYERAG